MPPRAQALASALARRVYRRVVKVVRPNADDRIYGSIVRRERRALWRARLRYEKAYLVPHEDPLVSVVIPTWNRAELVARAVSSVLRQTYENVEVVVVGDHCTDDTEARVEALDDPRIRFVNLAVRGAYPDDPKLRWLVAGTIPTNEGFRLARGKWIAQLDDDEIWTPDHVEALLRPAQRSGLELVWGRLRRWHGPEEWADRWDSDFAHGVCPPSVCLFRSYLRLFPTDPEAWRAGVGADRHRALRMQKAGVRGEFVDQVVALAPLRPGVTRLGRLAEDREGAASPE